MDLRDKVALVTGGAHRLGRAVALELARRGAHVAISYRSSAEAAERTAAEIEALGVRALALHADAADGADVQRMAERLGAEMGNPDVWVACAGVFRRTPPDSVVARDWDDMMRGNFATFRVPAELIGPQMVERGSGVIIAFADVAAIRPWSDYIPYSVSKSCVLHHARHLARELAPAVRVNTVLPGPVLFPPDYPEAERQRELANTLLGREGSADSIAAAVAFLVENDYLTGVALPVDGGRLLK